MYKLRLTLTTFILFSSLLAAQGTEIPHYANQTSCQLALTSMSEGFNSTHFLMRDSSGKGSYGIYVAFGKLIDPGKWDVCQRISEEVQYCLLESGIPIPIPGIDVALPITLAICAPDECTAEELSNQTYSDLAKAFDLPDANIPDFFRTNTVACRSKEPATRGSWIVLGILGGLLAIVLFGTLVDVIIRSRLFESFSKHESYDKRQRIITFSESDSEVFKPESDILYYDESSPLEPSMFADRDSTLSLNVNDSFPLLEASRTKPSKTREFWESIDAHIAPNQKTLCLCYFVQFCAAWSAVTNFKTLIHLNPSRVHQRFNFMNGIKVLALLWTVMGYNSFYVTIPGWYNIGHLGETESQFLYQLYTNSAVYSADIFFMFSGMLAVYYAILIIQQKTYDNPHRSLAFVNVPLYLSRRFARLWPSLIIAVFFYWHVSWLLGSGPYWPWYKDIVESECQESWWSAVFFLSSLYPKFYLDTINPVSGCMSWSWFISVDVICFCFTPLLLLLFIYRKWLACWITGCLIVGSIACGILICYLNNLSVGLGKQTDSDHGDYFDDYYNKPYTRAAPYFLGVLIAFVLHTRPLVRISLWVRVVCYSTIWPIIWALFFITYNAWESEEGWSDWENILFAGLSHPVFSVCFAVSMYLMSLGYNGPLNLRSFFGHPFWAPIARLSYGAFLYTPIVTQMLHYSVKVNLSYTTFGGIFLFFAFTIMSYIAGFLQYLLIERPLLNSFDFFVDLCSLPFSSNSKSKSK